MENSTPRTACQEVAARTDSATLRHVCKALEAEMLAYIEAGNTRGTQAHAGKCELMQACGEELYRRGDLLPPPAWQETDRETVDGVTIRLSFSVRVF